MQAVCDAYLGRPGRAGPGGAALSEAARLEMFDEWEEWWLKCAPPPPPPPPCTKRTRFVLPLVLIGHVSFFPPY